MLTVETINQPVHYNFSNIVPNSIPEIYNMALDVNHCLTCCIRDIEHFMNSEYSRALRTLRSFQYKEENEFTACVNHELNYYYHLFYEKKITGLLINNGNSSPQGIEGFVQHSLNNLNDKIENFTLICQQQERMTPNSLIILFLGLRDYCANFYQQMAANYQKDELTRCFYRLSELTDQISDEIGTAFSCT